MELFEAIKNRHSYRGEYKDIPVPREDLVKIVTAGIQAPSGCNAQTTSFIIVNDSNILTKLSQIVDHIGLKTAQAVVVAISEEKRPFKNMCFDIEDYSAATENILLAVTALGYASVWLDGILREDGCAERIAELLNIPDKYTVRVLLPIGVPKDQIIPVPKKPFDERVWFNSFQG